MCIRYSAKLNSTNAKTMCDAMDKCSMTRAHGMVNIELCRTYTVASLNCCSAPWKM